MSVVAKIKGLSFAFTSLHSWGFPLFPPTVNTRNKSDFEEIKTKATYALDYATEAVENVAEHKVDASFIGGDMNNNLENVPDAFRPFTNANYEILQSNEPTDINPGDVVYDYKYRTIDLLFASKQKRSFLHKIGQSIYSIFFTTKSISYSPVKVLESFKFTMNGTCSDHLPVGIGITIKETPSVISRIRSMILKKKVFVALGVCLAAAYFGLQLTKI